MKLSVNKAAGILYLWPTTFLLGTWYILLFTHNPKGVTPADTFKFVINEPPLDQFFKLLIALTILCIFMAIVFFTKWSKNRYVAVSLFAVGLIISATAWFYGQTMAVFLTMPMWHSFLNCKYYLIRK
jgi:general stress protein CsbA